MLDGGGRARVFRQGRQRAGHHIRVRLRLQPPRLLVHRRVERRGPFGGRGVRRQRPHHVAQGEAGAGQVAGHDGDSSGRSLGQRQPVGLGASRGEDRPGLGQPDRRRQTGQRHGGVRQRPPGGQLLLGCPARQHVPGQVGHQPSDRERDVAALGVAHPGHHDGAAGGLAALVERPARRRQHQLPRPARCGRPRGHPGQRAAVAGRDRAMVVPVDQPLGAAGALGGHDHPAPGRGDGGDDPLAPQLLRGRLGPQLRPLDEVVGPGLQLAGRDQAANPPSHLRQRPGQVGGRDGHPVPAAVPTGPASGEDDDHCSSSTSTEKGVAASGVNTMKPFGWRRLGSSKA